MLLHIRTGKKRYLLLTSWPAALCLLILAVLLLVGCSQSATSERKVLDARVDFSQETVEELPEPHTYRIGINTEVTGTGAQIGDLSIRAARLAVEEINAAGGVNGIPIELVVRDARSDPQVALTEYEKAIKEDNLDALLGPFKSAYGVRIVPAHLGSSLPMFIGATNETLTQRGDEHLFRMRPSDRLTAPAMLTFALEQLKAKSIGVVHDTDAFGSGGADRIEAELKQQRLEPAVRIGYATGTEDFDQLVQQLASANVEAVLIYGTNQTDVGHLLRAIRYWDLEVPIITSPGGASVVTHNVAAEAQDGIYVAVDAMLDASPQGVHFQQAFIDRFGMQPDTYIAWYYDVVHLLTKIWQEHPDASGEQLSQLIRTATYEGAQGTYCFDEEGEGLHTVILTQMQQGSSHPVGVYRKSAGFIASPDLSQLVSTANCDTLPINRD